MVPPLLEVDLRFGSIGKLSSGIASKKRDLNVVPTSPDAVGGKDQGSFVEGREIILHVGAPNMLQKLDGPRHWGPGSGSGARIRVDRDG